MDFSGNQLDGSQRRLGIVMGIEENMNAMIRRMDISDISNMYLKSSRTRAELASQLSFNGTENLGLCIDADQNNIIEEIIKYTRKSQNIRRRRIYQAYNYILFQLVRDPIIRFASRHGCDLSDLVFQTDSDCVSLVKDNGLHHAIPMHVHILADLVAWSHNHGVEPDGVISIDLKGRILESLKKYFQIK